MDSKKAEVGNEPKITRERETADVDSSIFVDDSQSAPVEEKEEVELDETESTQGDKDDVSPRLQNAYRIADDNGGGTWNLSGFDNFCWGWP